MLFLLKSTLAELSWGARANALLHAHQARSQKVRRTCLRRGGLAVPGTTQEEPRERLPRQPRRRGQGARTKPRGEQTPTQSNFYEFLRMNAPPTEHPEKTEKHTERSKKFAFARKLINRGCQRNEKFYCSAFPEHPGASPHNALHYPPAPIEA